MPWPNSIDALQCAGQPLVRTTTAIAGEYCCSGGVYAMHTFWYTNEYLKSSGTFNRSTEIARFRFASSPAP